MEPESIILSIELRDQNGHKNTIKNGITERMKDFKKGLEGNINCTAKKTIAPVFSAKTFFLETFPPKILSICHFYLVYLRTKKKRLKRHKYELSDSSQRV
jgi:hypothetical protein